MQLGVHHVGRTKPERVNRAVGYPHRAYDGRIDGRFEPDGLLGIHNLGLDTGRVACLDECRLVAQVILRQRDEQS